MDDEPLLQRYEYQQIADEVEADITSGRLPVGARLAGEHEMCELYGVSRNTVRHAVALLRDRGLVQTMPGKGSYVIRSRRPAGDRGQ